MGGTTGGSFDNTGIYSGSGGALTQIVRKGQAAPDGNGAYLSIGLPILNDSGAIAFSSTLTGTSGGSADASGIFRGNGESITQIARKGQIVPDGNGLFSNLNGQLSMNSAGAVAFYSGLTGTAGGSTDDTGIFRGSGGSITQIAREGQAAPDGNGSFSTLISPTVNDSGTVAFRSFLSGTSGGPFDNSGIFLGSGGNISQLAREGQVAPDGNGLFSSFNQLTINNLGAVAFGSDFTSTSGGSTDNSGIFLYGDGNITQIAREGQAAPDGNGLVFRFVFAGPKQRGRDRFYRIVKRNKRRGPQTLAASFAAVAAVSYKLLATDKLRPTVTAYSQY